MKTLNLIKYIMILAEVISVFLAFQLAYLISDLRNGIFFFGNSDLLRIFVCIVPFWLIILTLIKTTGIPSRRHKVLIFLYLQSAVAIFFLLTFFDYFLKLDAVPLFFLAELSLFAFMFLYFGRLVIYNILRISGVRGNNHVNAVIVADDKSLSFIENLLSKKDLGYKIVVIFTESELIKNKFENVSIILSNKFLGILNDLIKVDFVDEVLYMPEEPEPSSFREILRTCENLGVTLRLKSKETDVLLCSGIRADIDDKRFLSFYNIPNNSYALAIRKTMDINVALLMIVVLFPVLAVISLLVKLTSKGPLISTITTTGWRGQQIKIYRFRTTTEQTGMEGIKTGKKYTSIGKFLVKSGLDQLPQLFNILKGEIPIIVYREPLKTD